MKGVQVQVPDYVALLGWNPGDDREIFSLSELCEAFDVSGMSKSPVIDQPAASQRLVDEVFLFSVRVDPEFDPFLH